MIAIKPVRGIQPAKRLAFFLPQVLLLGFSLVQAFAATLVVTNNNDSGPGSLRQVLLDNETAGGGSTVTFSNVTGTISLTSGELGITNNLTLLGPGASVLAVSGSGSSRVFRVQAGTVSISDLTIENAAVTGTAGNPGMFGGNGGIGGGARGAGVFIRSTAMLSMTRCIIVSNTIYGGMGGLTDTGIAGPGGAGLGGGVGNAGTLSMTGCTLAYNTANGGQGGFVTSPTTGTAGNGGLGGGGGLYNAGTGTLSGCTLSFNSTAAGPPGAGPSGAGSQGSGTGGGINNDSMLILANCTIVDNVANMTSLDTGGGVSQSSGSIALRNCTITGNASATGGGMNNAGGTMDVGGTILSGNTASVYSPDANGSLNSSDFNLIKDSTGTTLSGSTTNCIFGVGAQLSSLRDNGGPTPTRQPLSGSRVIDQGYSFGQTTDQRGAPRPFILGSLPLPLGGDGSDIGAVELGNPRLSITLANTNLLLSWPAYYGSFAVQYNTQLTDANAWSSMPGGLSLSGTQYLVTNALGVTNTFFRLIGN
jgi:hypothetical protein